MPRPVVESTSILPSHAREPVSLGFLRMLRCTSAAQRRPVLYICKAEAVPLVYLACVSVSSGRVCGAGQGVHMYTPLPSSPTVPPEVMYSRFLAGVGRWVLGVGTAGVFMQATMYDKHSLSDSVGLALSVFVVDTVVSDCGDLPLLIHA